MKANSTNADDIASQKKESDRNDLKTIFKNKDLSDVPEFKPGEDEIVIKKMLIVKKHKGQLIESPLTVYKAIDEGNENDCSNSNESTLKLQGVSSIRDGELVEPQKEEKMDPKSSKTKPKININYNIKKLEAKSVENGKINLGHSNISSISNLCNINGNYNITHSQGMSFGVPAALQWNHMEHLQEQKMDAQDNHIQQQQMEQHMHVLELQTEYHQLRENAIARGSGMGGSEIDWITKRFETLYLCFNEYQNKMAMKKMKEKKKEKKNLTKKMKDELNEMEFDLDDYQINELSKKLGELIGVLNEAFKSNKAISVRLKFKKQLKVDCRNCLNGMKTTKAAEHIKTSKHVKKSVEKARNAWEIDLKTDGGSNENWEAILVKLRNKRWFELFKLNEKFAKYLSQRICEPKNDWESSFCAFPILWIKTYEDGRIECDIELNLAFDCYGEILTLSAKLVNEKMSQNDASETVNANCNVYFEYGGIGNGFQAISNNRLIASLMEADQDAMEPFWFYPKIYAKFT